MNIILKKSKEQYKVYIEKDGKQEKFDYIRFINMLYNGENIEEIIYDGNTSQEERQQIDKMVNEITKEERKSLIKLLKSFEIIVKGFRPIDEAIVTCGGINTKEIDPKTMQSKIIKGLYFAGEIIDVDAYTGGFNLQIAYSTGYTAGISI